MLYRRINRKITRILILLSICMVGISIPSGFGKVRADETGTEQTVDGPADLSTESVTYCIVLDPGHGGNDTGAAGWNSSEKRLNLLIGKYLKEELEKYENVRVEMTRDKDVFVDLHKRLIIARDKNADLVISLHNDSWDEGTPYDNGSSVLVAKKGTYRPEMAVQEVRLARSILSELEGIGLVNRGLVRKKSTRVPEYEDGSKGDYHAIIRDGMRVGIPSILVEHAFCDSKHDYKKFLKTNEQLRNLAAADARGVARFLQLKRKDTGEVLPSIEVKGKKQQCTADASAYYTLAQKRYNNTLYYRMLAGGHLRHASNQNLAESASARKEQAEAMQQEQEKARQREQETQIKAAEIADKNEAAKKKLPYVILGILGGFALVILIRELEFGFHISFRFRKRGNRYDEWIRWQTGYNMMENRKY